MKTCKNCGNEIWNWSDDNVCYDCWNIEEFGWLNTEKFDPISDLRLAYETLVDVLDCGDSGCPYKKKNEYGVYGMRTNGGCNCLGMKTLRGGQRRALQKLLHEVKQLLEE